MIIIENFPLPPSVNEYLAPVNGRLVKTKIHREYLYECERWRMKNFSYISEIKAMIKNWHFQCDALKRPLILKADCYFAFSSERLFTKTNQPKRLDADNRLKPCRDALSTLLDIDDKYFFAGSCEKVITRWKESECTIIQISQTTPKTLEQIKSQIKM